MKYIIDAKGKKLGRLASEIAVLLMNKNTPGFKKNEVADVSIKVTNASKLSIDARKIKDKEYNSYSGYPGGLKKKKMGNVISKKGMEFIIKKAVRGMLPNNKLRKERLKLLEVSE